MCIIVSNRLAEGIQYRNPDWSDEDIYQHFLEDDIEDSEVPSDAWIDR